MASSFIWQKCTVHRQPWTVDSCPPWAALTVKSQSWVANLSDAVTETPDQFLSCAPLGVSSFCGRSCASFGGVHTRENLTSFGWRDVVFFFFQIAAAHLLCIFASVHLSQIALVIFCRWRLCECTKGDCSCSSFWFNNSVTFCTLISLSTWRDCWDICLGWRGWAGYFCCWRNIFQDFLLSENGRTNTAGGNAVDRCSRAIYHWPFGRCFHFFSKDDRTRAEERAEEKKLTSKGTKKLGQGE